MIQWNNGYLNDEEMYLPCNNLYIEGLRIDVNFLLYTY